MCSTEGGPGNNDTCVSNVRLFLDCDASHLHKEQPSHVYYMELIDEHPDTDETMTIFADDLLERFGTVQNGWVVLVGDGKTYQHLQNIKRQYGSALVKLLIFPGDWHTLKNFQPVLMKIYYSAGLRELAKSSSYRGTTLNVVQTSREHIYFCYKYGKLCIGKC